MFYSRWRYIITQKQEKQHTHTVPVVHFYHIQHLLFLIFYFTTKFTFLIDF